MPTDSSSDRNIELDSDIPVTTLPTDGFQSRIPPYLLEGKSESEQFMLNEMSKMGHFIEWAAPLMINSNLEQRKTNGKVKALWAYKEILMSWKGAIAGLFALIAAISGLVEVWSFISDHLLKK